MLVQFFCTLLHFVCCIKRENGEASPAGIVLNAENKVEKVMEKK
jgi:hypothetical protein